MSTSKSKFISIVIAILFLTSCKTVSDKSVVLLFDLMEQLRPIYIEAKKLIRAKKFTREKKADYLKKFNKVFLEFLKINHKKYMELINKFNTLSESAKLNASVEFNNYYYDASEDYVEEDNEEDEIISQISFYELLTEHRTIISINSSIYKELAHKITIKRLEAIVLSEIVRSFGGGNFNRYLTSIIENILHKNLMRSYFSKYMGIMAKRLAGLKVRLGEVKFNELIRKKVMQQIEQTKGIMSVYVKRFIKKDLIKILKSRELKRFSIDQIKGACNVIIFACNKIVKELSPKYKTEKIALNKYKKVYLVDYPILESLIERWKKYNPIFSFSNRRRSIN